MSFLVRRVCKRCNFLWAVLTRKDFARESAQMMWHAHDNARLRIGFPISVETKLKDLGDGILMGGVLAEGMGALEGQWLFRDSTMTCTMMEDMEFIRGGGPE